MTADGDTARGGSAKSAPGRPRDGRIDAAIITATRELILETGYPALTLSAIAARRDEVWITTAGAILDHVLTLPEGSVA